MNFSNRKSNLKIPDTGAVDPQLRTEFLEDLPDNGKSRLRGVDISLINEALRAISEGHATINGKVPHNREERFIVIATYFKVAKTPLNMVFDGVINVKHKYTVVIKYEEQSFTFRFPDEIS